MSGGRFGRPINLNQHESRRVVSLLQDVEPRNARFLNALGCIGKGSITKGVYRIGFNMYVNMDDQHLPHSLPSEMVREAREDDMVRVQSIYAHYVLRETSTFEEVAPDLEEVTRRWRAVKAIGMPYLVAECQGHVVGYAYAGMYRPRTAYRFTVEDSIYIDARWLGQGIGSGLFARLLADSAQAGARQMIAVIGGSDNQGSIALHSRYGFRLVGTFTAVGFKFGQWLDSVLMQRQLTTSL